MNFIARYINGTKYNHQKAEFDALKQQSVGATPFLRGDDPVARKALAEQIANAKPPMKEEIKRSQVEDLARKRNAKSALETAKMLKAVMPAETCFTPAGMNAQRAVRGIEHFQVSVVGAFRSPHTGEEFTLYQSNFKGDTTLSDTGNLAIDQTRIEKPTEERQNAKVFFAKRKVRGRDGQMINDPKLAFRHENVKQLVEDCCRLAGVRPPAFDQEKQAQHATIKSVKEENLAAGWSMRKPVDPRQINMEAGIRQGNVIRPQFLPYQEKPGPAARREQEPAMKKAM